MFFHAHHGLDDPQGNGSWGLRINDAQQLTDNGKFKLLGEYVGNGHNFYTTYKSLINF
jgi:hypothetical protein